MMMSKKTLIYADIAKRLFEAFPMLVAPYQKQFSYWTDWEKPPGSYLLFAMVVIPYLIAQLDEPGDGQTLTKLFDFFEEAISGIVLAYAALDNFANEALPTGYVVFTDEDGKNYTREQIEATVGLEKRLSRVLSDALSRPNLRVDKPDLYERAVEIKKLRDDIGHSKLTTGYAGPGNQGLDQARIMGTIFSRLLAYPLNAVETINEVMEHYTGSTA